MDNKLPEEIYAWNYCGSFNTGLGLPVADMGDTPWAIYIRAQPKYKRVDLDTISVPDDLLYHEHLGYIRAINDIKSKYGDLYTIERE